MPRAKGSLAKRGWLQAQRGELVDGDEAFRKADDRIKKAGRKRA